MKSKQVLEAIKILNGLDDLDTEESDFYYDETNNYRKVRLRAGGLNFEGDGDFVLGGIALKRGESLDLKDLKQDIRLDKSAHEMKFKHVATGNIISALNSKKLKTVLEFLNERDISIHLQRINVFYWALIDVIESVMVEKNYQWLILNHLHIKDRLYNALNVEREKALEVLNDFAFPDVETSQIPEFYGRLVDLVKPTVVSGDQAGKVLIQVLELGKALEDAVFIQNDERGILLDDFSHFYRHRVLMFPKSMHYFDAEDKVEERIRATPHTYEDTTLDNYSFVDSKQRPEIQLADVTVGYFARLLNFCKGRSPYQLQSIRRNLNKTQLENLRIARELIDRSDSLNKAYFHHVVPISHQEAWSEFVY